MGRLKKKKKNRTIAREGMIFRIKIKVDKLQHDTQSRFLHYTPNCAELALPAADEFRNFKFREPSKITSERNRTLT